MLPIKLYPTFTVNQEYKKLDVNLKVYNKLPANLRCKGLTITFRVSPDVQRVYFRNQETKSDVTWNDVNDMKSLSNYVQNTYLKQENPKMTKSKLDPLQHENGLAEYNIAKRKIIWRLRNVKGQQTKNLDISLTFNPDVHINEL